MKKLVLALICLASSSAFATGLTAQFPKVAFGSVFVSLDGVCAKGDQLQTVKAVDVCTSFASGEGYCAKSEAKILSTSRTYTHEIAVGEGAMESITETYPLAYSIPVGYDTEAGFVAVTEMPYTIPACN
jgi:hypothetical protein